MANAYANALKIRRELLAKLAEVDRFLALHDQFSGTERARNEPAPSAPPAPIPAESRGMAIPDAVEPAPSRKKGRPADFAGIAERVLAEVGRPMTRAQLVSEIEARGVPVPSDDKPRYIGTILWRHKDTFVNVAGEGYSLRRQMDPAAAKEADLLSEMVSGGDGKDD